MGVVYEATHPQRPGQRLAVKVLLETEGGTERFWTQTPPPEPKVGPTTLILAIEGDGEDE